MSWPGEVRTSILGRNGGGPGHTVTGTRQSLNVARPIPSSFNSTTKLSMLRLSQHLTPCSLSKPLVLTDTKLNLYSFRSMK